MSITKVLVLNKCDVCAKCNACKACLRCHTGAKHESEIFDTVGKTVNILAFFTQPGNINAGYGGVRQEI